MKSSTVLRLRRTTPLPYLMNSILPSEIQCRIVHGLMPRSSAASVTVRRSSVAIARRWEQRTCRGLLPRVLR
jgi:hypothetical protein